MEVIIKIGYNSYYAVIEPHEICTIMEVMSTFKAVAEYPEVVDKDSPEISIELYRDDKDEKTD